MTQRLQRWMHQSGCYVLAADRGSRTDHPCISVTMTMNMIWIIEIRTAKVREKTLHLGPVQGVFLRRSPETVVIMIIGIPDVGGLKLRGEQELYAWEHILEYLGRKPWTMRPGRFDPVVIVL